MAGLHATRFVAKIYLKSKLVEHKKSGLIFYFGLPRLSQSRSHGFLVWFGSTRHELSLARSLALRARRSNDRATRSKARLVSKSMASLLDRGMQRVNWLPPRTIVARVFLKIIFRGCPIIHSLSNGAMLERLVNATL